MEVQNTRTSEARPKRKEKNTPRTSKTHQGSHLHLSPTFFRHNATFFEIFWIAPKGPPSFVSIFCNTLDDKKSQRIPPFTFFGTVTLFKNHINQILGNSLKSKSLEVNPPFTILRLRYSANFRRSRLVFILQALHKRRQKAITVYINKQAKASGHTTPKSVVSDESDSTGVKTNATGHRTF